MKLFFGFLLLLGFSMAASSQSRMPVRKIHGYKQANIPGARPIQMDDKGNRVSGQPKVNYNYWFYVETAKSDKITITDLWIEGKRFKAKSLTVTERTPLKKIIHSGSMTPDTVILVAKTVNRLFLVTPGENLRDSVVSSRYLSKLIANSELVIGYFWKGKKYFVSLPLLTILPAEAHQ